MLKIALLGSTGSIGRQVLSVVDRNPELFKIVSLSAGSNAKLLEEQINKYKPQIATLYNSEKAFQITSIPPETTLYTGENALLHAINGNCDIVFVAIMGFAGLKAVKYAIELKKNIALANKETLVAGGEMIMPLAEKNGVKIIPVDSEHSAIWQCLNFNSARKFKKLIITASGGALRDLPKEKLPYVTAKDALKHPNWQMGDKITIDCATMVNKGFEVIEAKWLFNTSLNNIDVLIHPESIIHSMVEFEDGAVMAQMANPSMELPITLALTYPERIYSGVSDINFIGKSLNFHKVDDEKYPCFNLVLKTAEKGYNFPCALSGANEEAVKLFLNGKISYTDIYGYISYALEKTEKLSVDLDSLIYTDGFARRCVYERYEKMKAGK